jgi:hypothetical protein
MNDYPEETRSLIHVTFIDGEVRTYPTSAGPAISGHLQRQLNEGAINLYVRTKAVVIPREQVRFFEVEGYGPQDLPVKSKGKKDVVVEKDDG